MGPEVWGKVLGNGEGIIPYNNPALFSIPIAFIVTMIVSINDNSADAKAERAVFSTQYVRSQVGGEGIAEAIQQYRQVNHPDFNKES